MHWKNHIGYLLILSGILTAGLAKGQNLNVHYHFAGNHLKDSSIIRLLDREMPDRQVVDTFLILQKNKLTSRGYITASVDSVKQDSTGISVWIFPGKKYVQILDLDSLAPAVRSSLKIYGRKGKVFATKAEETKAGIMDYYENTGYPFAKVSVSNQLRNDTVLSHFKVEKGVLYHIDSIRILGKAKLKSSFLQNYLGIRNNSIYNKEQLSKVGQLMDNLPYVTSVQEPDLMMLGTGATLNLYLEPKRSSEINALIGFLPANTITGKAKITADVRLNLKNALAGGETIFINWQQIEAGTPRLDLAFTQPYVLGTPYGLDLSFGMLKQDSSYLQLNAKLGVRYLWSANKYVSVFYQLNNSLLMQGGIDTQRIMTTRSLPPNLDVRSGNAGLTYHFQDLDYELNPRKGIDITVTATAGIRKVGMNNNIIDLKDRSDPDFDFRSLYDTVRLKSQFVTGRMSFNHYSSVGKNSVLKLSGKGGLMMAPQIFQNELYRIGGYKLLRGFDEESIFADKYLVLTGEYRLLTGLNSFLFGFVDYGLTHTKLPGQSFGNSFVSTGLGLELETGFGLLNVSYAIGKRNDVSFDIRNASKIHFGYINYF